MIDFCIMDLYKGRYRRDSKRKQGYDYGSPGYYFVTINVRNRSPIFGDVSEGNHWLSPMGMIADHCWNSIPDHYPHAIIDEHIIMPDHVHGIIQIYSQNNGDGDHVVATNNYSSLLPHNPKNHTIKRNTPFKSPSRTISSIVRGFKIGVTKWARQNGYVNFQWQPNYYDRIIRSPVGLAKVRQYIRENPWNM